MTAVSDQPVSANDRQAARAVGAEVVLAGGRLRVSGSTLLALFDGERFDHSTAARIARALSAEAVVCVPELDAGLQGADLVELRSTRDVRTDDEPVIDDPPRPEPVGAPRPGDVLAAEATALPAGALTAGVLVPGALLAAAGFVGYWLYGVVFVALAAATWLLARYARVWLARIFYLPVGSAWLTGFALTAMPLLIASILAAALVIAPLASGRATDARQDRAAAAMLTARDALADGDLERAQRELAAARSHDGGVAGAGALERAIADERERRAAEAAREAEYDRARAALDEGDERAAIGLLDGLGDYSDSAALARAARGELAAERLTAARNAFAAGDYARARSAATDSLGIAATPTARRLQQRAGAALARQRAVARARAKAQARARAQARAQARREAAERRRQRELERELREQQEEQAAAAPPPAVPAGTCSEIAATDFPVPPGDPRDADGDGIACES